MTDTNHDENDVRQLSPEDLLSSLTWAVEDSAYGDGGADVNLYYDEVLKRLKALETIYADMTMCPSLPEDRGQGARYGAERLGFSREDLERSADNFDVITGKRGSAE